MGKDGSLWMDEHKERIHLNSTTTEGQQERSCVTGEKRKIKKERSCVAGECTECITRPAHQAQDYRQATKPSFRSPSPPSRHSCCNAVHSRWLALVDAGGARRGGGGRRRRRSEEEDRGRGYLPPGEALYIFTLGPAVLTESGIRHRLMFYRRYRPLMMETPGTMKIEIQTTVFAQSIWLTRE